jgi:hypothetical protein
MRRWLIAGGILVAGVGLWRYIGKRNTRRSAEAPHIQAARLNSIGRWRTTENPARNDGPGFGAVAAALSAEEPPTG